MKKELLLTAMITASITTTVAAANIDIRATTTTPLSMQNSIAYGGDNKIESGIGSPVANILLGGDKNKVRSSASNSITSGMNNTASGPGNIVAGWYNESSATHSLVVGTSNTVGGTNNIVGGFGHTNNDNAINSLLVGARNSIDGQNSVALGMNNTIKGNNALVGGTGAKVQGNNAIAFGDSAKATYDDAYAIGRKAEATAQNTVAIGNNAKANNSMGTAIGYSAKAKNDYATAVGYMNTASGNQSSALGYENEAAGHNASALGSNNTTSADYSNAIGYKNTASNTQATAVGVQNTASGDSTFAAGVLSSATKIDAVSIGHSANATGEYTVAIGSNASAANYDSIAIGKNANASKAGTVVIGRNATSNSELSLAVGTDTESVWGGTAVGVLAKATGTQSTALGNGANATSVYATAVGVGAQATGISATAVGISKATGNHSIAVGHAAESAGKQSIAVGADATATLDNSVALGNNAKTNDVVGTASIAINGETHIFAGGTPVGTVSVGDTGKERTITNVAAGRIDATSTDAINGSQLNAVINSLNFPTVVDGDNTTVSESVNINGGKEFKVDVNKNLTNMNSAVFKDDSTDKSYFNPIVYTPTTSNLDKRGETKIDGSVIQLHGPKENTDSQEQVTSLTGKELRFVREGDYQTVIGINGIDILQKDTGALLAPGKLMVNGYEDDDDTKTYRELEFSATKVDVGGQQIHGVTAGTEDTDAVNVSQLKEVKQLTVDNKKIIENHEGRIGDLENKVIDVGHDTLNQANNYTDSQVAKVGAASAALAGLHPLDFDKHDKWSYSVGFGNYKNANAAALGAFYRPNKNTMFNAATTVGNGRNTISLGANFKFGKSSEEVTTEEATQLKKDMKDLSEKYNELAKKYNELAAKLESK